MKRKMKVLIILVAAAGLLAAAGALTMWLTFFPNPFSRRVTSEEISPGTVYETENSNILVAYFSLSGNRDYPEEGIDAVASASLEIRDGQFMGHAEILAMAAQKATGGKLFFIEVVDKYPETYLETMSRHRNEMFQNIKPEITDHVENMDSYKTIILIYPSWMSRAPQAVLTFLEEYDLSGKTIVPIVTSQASGRGTSVSQLKGAFPSATVTDGLGAKREDSVIEYLSENGYSK